MELNVVELANGIATVNMSGRMDVAGSLAVDPVFAKIVADKHKVVADMSEVTFLASLGIRTLMVSCKALAEKGGNLVILAPQPGVAKVLKSSAIDTIIPVVADMGAAETILLG